MSRSFRPFPLPTSTGNLRDDLVKLLSAFEHLLDGQPFPRLLAAFMDAAERDPRLKSAHAELTKRRREPLRVLLTLARGRGEIQATVDLDLAIDLLAGPLFYRRFVAHRGCPDDCVASVVGRVLSSLGYVDSE